MFKFAAELSQAWIGPRTRALWWYYSRRLAGGRWPVRLTIRPPNGRPNRTLIWRTADDARQSLRMFSDYNIWERYPLPRTANTIVDLGANVGLSILYWTMRYPSARVFAVEMDQHNVSCCQEHVSLNGLPAVVVHAAVATKAGTISYRRHASNSRHQISSLDQLPDGFSDEQVTVEGVTLDALFDRFQLDRVDVLKVDIEGAEEFLLNTIDRWGPRVKVMLLELHHNIVYEDAIQIVRGAGFEILSEERGDERTELYCCRE